MTNTEQVRQKRIWVTWEIQRRNRSMSRVLGAKLFELTSDRNRLLRYFVLILKTVGILWKERPNIVFAQNPSIVLSLLIVLAARSFSYRAVIDEHNSGLFPLDGKSSLLNLAARFIIRKANLLIVTNQSLANYCKQLGGRVLVYPDPLPELEPRYRENPRDWQTKLIFVCSWAADEPYPEVLEAAKHLDPKYFQILITGKYQGKQDPTNIPSSVELVGFIPDEEYVHTLGEADGAIILTKRENCMNCGAYEAVALNVPGILSDRRVLRDYFGDAFLYTENDSVSIEKTIYEFSAYKKILKNNVKRRKLGILETEQENVNILESYLDGMMQGALEPLADKEK